MDIEANTGSGCAGADVPSRPHGSEYVCECQCRFWGRSSVGSLVLPARGGAAAGPGTPHSSWRTCSLSPDWRSWMMAQHSSALALDMADGGGSAGPAQSGHWEEGSVFCSGKTTAAPCRR